jgi:UDP-GlcNAc:undecaprenyl-phosphate/decaprenyl-phosphate GlcNAc-1-phosphate transferase
LESLEWASLIPPLVAAIAALVISAVVTPIVRYLARRYGFVAQPRPDRWHRRPTALLGGVAIFLATVVPLVVLAGHGRDVWLLAAGLTGIFLLGLVDDVVKLPPQQKLVGQIVLASLVSAGGIAFDGLPIKIVAVPLTVFWLVAITNAFNLLDNMDGLSAGIACVTGVVLAAIGVLEGSPEVAVAGAAVAGASLGFLIYNSSPASIFMGDAGSMPLGFIIGALAVLGNHYGTSQNVVLTLVVPIVVLGVPLFDTTLVSLLRPIYGRSISQGGRDHTSHRLVALGLSEKQTVRVLYVISAIFGGFALTTRFMDVLMSVAVLGLLLVGLVLFGAYLAQVKVYRDATPNGLANGHAVTVIGGTLMYKMRLAEVFLDLMLIFVAYLGAYLLKFEGTLSGPFLDQFAKSLPFIIVLKLATFLLASVYGGNWKYAGLPEMVEFTKASTIASMLCAAAVALVWHFDGFSRSVFVIDWLLFTALVTASRMSYRLLAHWIQSLAGARDGRLLVIGTRDRGANVLRAIQQGVFGEYEPVGFVDVGESVRDSRVAGVEVLGPMSRLGIILEETKVDGVVIALDGKADVVSEIVEECSTRGVLCRQAALLEMTSDEVTVARPKGRP